jgi:hypothetical protein
MAAINTPAFVHTMITLGLLKYKHYLQFSYLRFYIRNGNLQIFRLF